MATLYGSFFGILPMKDRESVVAHPLISNEQPSELIPNTPPSCCKLSDGDPDEWECLFWGGGMGR